MYLDRQANSHQEPDQRNIVAKKSNAIDVDFKSNDHGWTDLVEKKEWVFQIPIQQGQDRG